MESSNLKNFSLSELKIATKNFRPDSFIGDRGYISVFKGWIDEQTLVATKYGSGMAIAVKRLNPDARFNKNKDWLAEVNYLGQLNHPNLVKLIGFCLEDEYPFLVYEFMTQGSLKDHLFGRGPYFPPLSWNQRMKIALDAAKGLAFLHSVKPQVIYGQLDTSDILLDSKYNAKLSDFGSARNRTTCEDRYEATWFIQGTNYANDDPDYFKTGYVTSKSDVYKFGVVLLQLLSGKQAMDYNRPLEQHNLVDWAKPYLLNHKTQVSHVMDTNLEGQYSKNKAQKAANITLRCIAPRARDRPTMKEIVKSLEELQSSEKSTCNLMRILTRVTK